MSALRTAAANFALDLSPLLAARLKELTQDELDALLCGDDTGAMALTDPQLLLSEPIVFTPITAAARFGDRTLVRQLLGLLKSPHSLPSGALQLPQAAAAGGLSDLCTALVSDGQWDGLDVSMFKERGPPPLICVQGGAGIPLTPLHCAILARKLSVVQSILPFADINAHSFRLCLALRPSETLALQLLGSASPDLLIETDFRGQSLLSYAARNNFAFFIRRALEAGATPEPPAFQTTHLPLHEGVAAGAYEAVEVLLEGGADPDRIQVQLVGDGVTPLGVVLLSSERLGLQATERLSLLLIQHGACAGLSHAPTLAQPIVSSDEGESMMLPGCVLASPNTPRENPDGLSIFPLPIFHLDYFVARQYAERLLICACRAHCIPAVQELLRQGVSPDAIDYRGRSARDLCPEAFPR